MVLAFRSCLFGGGCSCVSLLAQVFWLKMQRVDYERLRVAKDNFRLGGKVKGTQRHTKVGS
jgi:hypothetical protein